VWLDEKEQKKEPKKIHQSLEFGVFGVLKIQNLQISHIAQFSILLWHSFTLSNAVFSPISPGFEIKNFKV